MERAISNTALGKSPGPDGYSILYYKKISKILVPKLCNYFNALGAGEMPREESLLAHITLIFKEGKDPAAPGSYRQISLLNTDIKIFTKILADRLKVWLPGWVHNDQVGFVPGREGRDNSLKSIFLIQEVIKRGTPAVLMSIDAEKAFDRVDWGFMFETLRYLGVGERMMGWISSLYHHPKAKIRVNGTLSSPLELFNGTRQGCPLSPILFILTLEPLLAAIWKNPDIGGIRVGEREYKVAAFADDLLCYISNPRITIPMVLKEFLNGELSNFRINMAKSELLNITLSRKEQRAIQPGFPFMWCREELGYLGIRLTSAPSDLFKANYIPPS